MEGPSLFLAAEQLQPFVGRVIKKVSGNTKIGKERLEKKKILSIFSYGKYLFFQFDTFALRVHFMLYGSFQATVKNIKVTGDYPTKNRAPRLALEMSNGHIEMYSCSVRYIEDSHARDSCDYSIDIMSDQWNAKKALAKMRKEVGSEIADVLLDQTIFLGVGNIIKNETLLQAGIAPQTKVRKLSEAKLKELIQIVRDYVFQFYEWRKIFELKKHYQVYRQSFCKVCGGKVSRKKTGQRNRVSFICTHCEK
jgi:endonuclease-8